MMTREDMLRELELLPVWQLRVPVAEPILTVEKLAEIQPIEIAVEKSAYEKPLSFSEPELETQAPAIELEVNALENVHSDALAVAQELIYQCVASDDNAYLFVMAPDEISADAATLQCNMWRAMRVNTQASVHLNVDAINVAKYKIIITMGERVAQQLLNTQAPLEKLRTTVHQYKKTPLIATFDAVYLLQNPHDKPQAWADLCFAMQTLLDLKSAK